MFRSRCTWLDACRCLWLDQFPGLTHKLCNSKRHSTDFGWARHCIMSTAQVTRRGPVAPPPDEPQPLIAPWMRTIAFVLLGQVALQAFKSYQSTGSLWPQGALTPQTAVSGQSESANVSPLQADSGATSVATDLLPQNAVPLWPLGTPLSFYIYLSTTEHQNETIPSYTSEPLVSWNDISYGDWKETRSTDLIVDLAGPEFEAVLHGNGSLWADIVTIADGARLNSKEISAALREPKKGSVARKR